MFVVIVTSVVLIKKFFKMIFSMSNLYFILSIYEILISSVFCAHDHFSPVDNRIRKSMCEILNITENIYDFDVGAPKKYLTKPSVVMQEIGEGNKCFYSAISVWLTGSSDYAEGFCDDILSVSRKKKR